MGIHSLYLLTISALISAYLWRIGTFQRIYPPSYRTISELVRPFQVSGWGKPTSQGHVPYLPIVRSDLIEALYLLQLGDAWGAEIICQSLSKNLITDAKSSNKRHIEQEETTDHQKQKHFLVDILICLGEARLLLHQQSYNSIMNRFSSKHPDSIMEALLNTQILSSLDKLYSAKASFETAVSLDPMNPRARSGLGLTLLLLGTRSTTSVGATEEDQSRVERSNLNLLFDATLHLNAAVTITESWVDKLQKDVLVSPVFQAIDKTTHVTALYNNALAHLALGDHNAALRLLRRVHDSLCSKEMSKPCDTHRRLSIPLVNIVGVFVQLGKIFEALELLLEMDVIGYCSSLETSPTTVDRVIFMSRKPVEDRLAKICMILLNNRDVVVELKTYSGFNITTMEYSSLLQDKLYEISTQLSEIFIHSYNMQDLLGFAKMNHDQFTKTTFIDDTEKQLSTTAYISSNPSHEGNHSSQSSVKHALNALEKAASVDPGNSRMWLSLTRAKLVAGDFMGAVEAATKAINVANGFEEIEAATRTLEQAIERLSNDESKTEYSEARAIKDVMIPTYDDEKPRHRQQNDAEIQSLQLERDILTLKLQLLHQDIKSQQFSIQDMSPPQEQIIKEYQRESFDSSGKSIHEEDQVKHESDRPDNNVVIDMVPHEHQSNSNHSGVGEAYPDIANSLHENMSNNSGIDESHVTIATRSYPDSTTNDKPAYHDAPFYGEEDTITIFNESSVNDSNYVPIKGDDLKDGIRIELPVLFKPAIIDSTDISPTAASYMKIADALMEKDQFQQAAKQFSKVLKRHPDHLPASLGYATAFERSSNQNQLEEVSIAYLQAAQGALQRGAYDLANAIMRRAIDVSVPITKQKRLGVLKQLFNYSHTDTIAAEISYQIGRLSLSFNDNIKEARHSFHLANALVVREIGNSSACHAPSSLELGKIALDIDSDYKLAILFIENALSAGLKESEVQGLVILGRSKAMAGDLAAAKAAFMEAISRPTSEFSAQAHYHIGVLLMNDGGDNEIVEKHFITALNLGLDATEEIIDILGEYHLAVLKSTNRVKRREYEKSLEKDSRSGGVLGGASFSDKSIFQKSQENPASKSETLSLLEQGAASYDGQKLPDGEEMGENVQSGNLPKTRKSQHAII